MEILTDESFQVSEMFLPKKLNENVSGLYVSLAFNTLCFHVFCFCAT